MHDLFISYSSQDSHFAAKLKEDLVEHGYKPFLFEHENMLKFVGDINDALSNTQYLILVLSESSLQSTWVKEEWQSTFQKEQELGKELIVPIKIQDCDIPHLLKSRNCYDFSETVHYQHNLMGLIKTLQSIDKTNDFVDDMSIQKPREKSISLYESDNGIVKIYDYRRDNTNLMDDIQDEIKNSNEILMMGNSLRDFVGPSAIKKNNQLEKKILDGNTKIKFLLLNPLSDPARRRAFVEHANLAYEESSYPKLSLFKDICKVAKWFDQEINIKTKENIEVNFSSDTPTVLLIKTREFTFLEQYHMGRLSVAGPEFVELAYEYVDHDCIGGNVPVFKIKNESPYAKFMGDHFDNAWKRAMPFEEMSKEIQEYDEDVMAYRRKQLITYLGQKLAELEKINK